MAEVHDLFSAKARSLGEVYRDHFGVAGFRIPNYQRHFDWDKEKISRLFEDCVGGFSALASTGVHESFTFLGTIILVRGSHQEPTFSGTSLDVVDGQQRLTTLAIMACVLQDEIQNQLNLCLADPGKRVDFWLREEAKHQLETLYDCVVGMASGRGRRFDKPFPRIVRHVDNRGRTSKESEYRSLIARLLLSFAEYVDDKRPYPFHFRIDGEGGEAKRFNENVDYILKLIRLIVDSEGEGVDRDVDTGVEIPSVRRFNTRGYRNILFKLPAEEDEANSLISAAIKATELHPLFRATLFSSYFTTKVALTSVEVGVEEYAFDIFDALNTTGEPLTAIETFRPRVIDFEERLDGYDGSPSQLCLTEVEEFTDRFPESTKRQSVTKDLIVSFALYSDGKKLGKQLSEQRRFLRKTYDRLPGKGGEPRRRFVQLLSDVANYALDYWEEEGIKVASVHQPEVAFCLSYLRDLKTSLTIPVLTRYHQHSERIGTLEIFHAAVRALTAFVFFRRSATGQTRGIDTDLRRLMARGGPGERQDNLPLKAGLRDENEIPSLDNLKGYLRDYLAQGNVGVTDRRSWVNSVKVQPLAEKSKPTCRFMFLAALHQAAPDGAKRGLLTRQGVRRSPELDYLNYQNWTSDRHKTVEHIAPDSAPGSGWDPEIYTKPTVRHEVGNLILLPERENESVGNSVWRKKRIYYRAFAARSESELEECLTAAREQGLTLSKRAEALLHEKPRLPLADAIARVEAWDASIIEQRTINLAELAWDAISEWLYEQ